MSTRSACTGGVMGWLFGHKFMRSSGGYTYTWDFCYRCGKAREVVSR